MVTAFDVGLSCRKASGLILLFGFGMILEPWICLCCIIRVVRPDTRVGRENQLELLRFIHCSSIFHNKIQSSFS